MSKHTRIMVYSAMTEDQVIRQFEQDAAKAAREGYAPLAQSWDGNSLTVTYGVLEGPRPVAEHDQSQTTPADTGWLPARWIRRLLPSAGA